MKNIKIESIVNYDLRYDDCEDGNPFAIIELNDGKKLYHYDINNNHIEELIAKYESAKESATDEDLIAILIELWGCEKLMLIHEITLPKEIIKLQMLNPKRREYGEMITNVWRVGDDGKLAIADIRYQIRTIPYQNRIYHHLISLPDGEMGRRIALDDYRQLENHEDGDLDDMDVMFGILRLMQYIGWDMITNIGDGKNADIKIAIPIINPQNGEWEITENYEDINVIWERLRLRLMEYDKIRNGKSNQ